LPYYLANSTKSEREVFDGRQHLLFGAIFEVAIDTFCAFFVGLDNFTIEILESVSDRFSNFFGTSGSIIHDGRGLATALTSDVINSDYVIIIVISAHVLHLLSAPDSERTIHHRAKHINLH